MGIIELHNISKSYGDRKAVSDICFSVNEGELFGLIGPDGAGKTTLFRILTTLLLPDSGNAVVCGFDTTKDYQSIRNIAGYMPGRFSLYQDLTVSENLEFFASVFNTSVKENYNLIHDIYIQLEPFSNRMAGKLSGGMKQKLALCCALVHRPKVLFLDEPTTGVDAVSRKEFWEMLNRMKKEGITILVSTPYMDEAGQCDRVALIQNGKIFTINTPEGIKTSYNTDLYAMKSANMFRMMQLMRSYPLTDSYLTFGEAAHVTFLQPMNGDAKLQEYLEQNDLKDVVIEKISPTIEDVFIRYLS